MPYGDLSAAAMDHAARLALEEGSAGGRDSELSLVGRMCPDGESQNADGTAAPDAAAAAACAAAGGDARIAGGDEVRRPGTGPDDDSASRSITTAAVILGPDSVPDTREVECASAGGCVREGPGLPPSAGPDGGLLNTSQPKAAGSGKGPAGGTRQETPASGIGREGVSDGVENKMDGSPGVVRQSEGVMTIGTPSKSGRAEHYFIGNSPEFGGSRSGPSAAARENDSGGPVRRQRTTHRHEAFHQDPRAATPHGRRASSDCVKRRLDSSASRNTDGGDLHRSYDGLVNYGEGEGRSGADGRSSVDELMYAAQGNNLSSFNANSFSGTTEEMLDVLLLEAAKRASTTPTQPRQRRGARSRSTSMPTSPISMSLDDRAHSAKRQLPSPQTEPKAQDAISSLSMLELARRWIRPEDVDNNDAMNSETIKRIRLNAPFIDPNATEAQLDEVRREAEVSKQRILNLDQESKTLGGRVVTLLV